MARGDFNQENPHLEMQAVKTISFFKQNISKMKDPQVQALCRLLLFEDNYLESILQDDPLFAQNLASFIHEGWSQF